MTVSRRALFASAAGSGLLIAAAFPPLDMTWLAFVAWAPYLLCLMAGPRGKDAALAGAIHIGALHVPQCWWMVVVMRVHAGVPPPASLALYAMGFVIIAPWGMLAGWMGAALGRRHGPWALLMLPWAWALLDIARTRLALGFPWLLPGMTLAGHPELMGFADVAGVHGLGVVVLLANAAVALLVLMLWRRRADCTTWRAAVVASVVVAGSLVHGFMACARNDRGVAWTRVDEGADAAAAEMEWPERGVRLALVQGAQPQEVKIHSTAQEDRDLAAVQLELTERALARGARAIIWAESSHPSTTRRLPWLLPAVQQRLVAADRLAAAAGSPRSHEVIIGAVVEGEATGGEATGRVRAGKTDVFNSALLVTSSGVTGRYDKRRLVPFGEYLPAPVLFGWFPQIVQAVGDFVPGGSDAPIVGADAAFGLSICYEIVLPPRVRVVTRAGADVLVNITNDGWYHGTWMPEQHLRFAAMRAVEMRRPVVRAANSGISAIIAPSGRITARMEEGRRGLILAAIEPVSSRSPYARWGDLPMALLGLIAAAWALSVGWPRPHPAPAMVASASSEPPAGIAPAEDA